MERAEVAADLGRPLLLARADDLGTVMEWLASLTGAVVLNVAGPRESEQPGLYAAVHRTLTAALGVHSTESG